MKNIISTFLLAFTFLLGSCTVQERIIFNEDMGGRYETTIDVSQLLALGGKGQAKNADKKKKTDTLVVFNELLLTHKDSIAGLPLAEREKLEALKDMSFQMNIDETEGVMIITVAKDFTSFNEIERVAYDMDKAFDSAKKSTPSANQASSGPAKDMLSMDKVIYTFTDNTFRRTDPASLSEHLEDEGILSEKTQLDLNALAVNNTDSEPLDDMMKGMMDQMDEELQKSMMKLEYVFPRKIVSVSPEGAVISEDGKTVTFTVDFKTLLEDNSKALDNFEVVLEDK